MSGDERSFQMLWACEYCDTKDLLALSHKHCPVCGAAQSVSRRYYPDEGSEVSVENHVFSGADVVCGGCGAPNGAAAKFCGSCGSDLENARTVTTRDAQEVAEGEHFASDSARNAREEHRQKKLDDEAERVLSISGQSAKDAPSRFGPVSVVAIIVFGLFATGILCFGLTWVLQKEVAVEAMAHEWSRTIDIEEYQTHREQAWKEQVPSRGRVVSCVDKVQRHRTVEDGETCKTVRTDKGDGTFTKKQKCTPKYKKVPVQGRWCTYTIERWGVVRTVSSEGGFTDPRVWPSVELTRLGVCLGCQREGSRKEQLIVRFKDTTDNAEYTAHCTEQEWLGVKQGARYEALGRMGSTSLNCSTLKSID